MSKIITIGRELGSGGRTIGKMVANKLGIPYYDRELIDKAADKAGLSVPYVETNEQRVTNSFLYNIAMGTSYGYGILENANNQALPLSEQVYIAQKDVITGFANEGACVIVGRCADQILKDRDDLLSVFIYADKKSRANHAINDYGMERDKIEKELKKSDHDRSQHYNNFTEKEWGERHNYDLLLNSGALGYERCADIIISAAGQ